MILLVFIERYINNQKLISYFHIENTEAEPLADIAASKLLLHEHLQNSSLSQAVKLAILLDTDNRVDRLAMAVEEQVQYFLLLLRTYLFIDHDEAYDKQSQVTGFYQDCLHFSQYISNAVPKIEELLLSKTNTDVAEAIDFFTTGYLFNIKNTESGVRRMLNLLWSGDKEKRTAVMNAYNRILFQTDSDGRTHAIRAVNNLCQFFEQINTGEYFALETLIKEWLDSSTIDATMIQVMFERLTKKLPDTTDNQARICLQYLIMISK